jgi:hypothetical protein
MGRLDWQWLAVGIAEDVDAGLTVRPQLKHRGGVDLSAKMRNRLLNGTATRIASFPLLCHIAECAAKITTLWLVPALAGLAGLLII